jgi:hypothetical protein
VEHCVTIIICPLLERRSEKKKEVEFWIYDVFRVNAKGAYKRILMNAEYRLFSRVWWWNAKNKVGLKS